MSDISKLATRQLDAYNASDLEGFVACYHEDVLVLKGEEQSIRGKDAFRERYTALFSEWTFGAAVPNRFYLGKHCVDYERWWRIAPGSVERSEGEVIVRYTLRDGLIGIVQFLS